MKKTLLPLFAVTAFAFALTLVSPNPAAALFDVGGILPGGNGAPEIDPSVIGSALALVLGGTAMVADRFRH